MLAWCAVAEVASCMHKGKDVNIEGQQRASESHAYQKSSCLPKPSVTGLHAVDL